MMKLLAVFSVASLMFLAAGSVSAQEKLRGYGFVDHVNAGTRIISVNQREYSVPIHVRPTRESGAVVPLAELHGVLRPPDALVASGNIDFVRFEAVKKRDVWQMVKITVLDGVPE
jgi:hypothetical protein